MTDETFSHGGMPDTNGTTVFNVLALAQLRRLTEQLTAILLQQAVLDQALGVVMSQSGCTAVEAMTGLRKQSWDENRNLSETARRVVDNAVTRARHRGLA